MLTYKKKHENQIIELKVREGVPLFEFRILKQQPEIKHCFTTRLGGVSTGEFSTMNFITIRGDSKEAVAENYRRVAKAMGVPYESLTASYQTHTTNIRRIGKKDRGKGVSSERDYQDVDGLITNEPDITLATFYADCVPLYFFDPKKKAIGLSHAGWKGTVGNIAAKTIAAMREAFGSLPADILVCIGPSICQDCYEVGADVARCFQEVFTEEDIKCILQDKGNGKYHLDLWKANELFLLAAGILPENIAVTNVCTCCNPELLFSHRASKGRRGNLGAFLALTELN